MRVSCGWQPLFEYLFCCKQRSSKFRKTGFFKSVKATSCSSNAASNTFELDSKLQAMPHYSVLSSQWILNWTDLIHVLFTRCLNKEWQTWELWIPSYQEKPAHLCLEPIPAVASLTGIDEMQNHSRIGFFLCNYRVEIRAIWRYTCWVWFVQKHSIKTSRGTKGNLVQKQQNTKFETTLHFSHYHNFLSQIATKDQLTE